MESRTRGSPTKGRRLSMCKIIEECDIISDRISGIKKSTKLLAVEVWKLGHTR